MSDFLSHLCDKKRGEVQAMQRGLKKEILWLLECKGMNRHGNAYSWHFMFFRIHSLPLFLKSVIKTSGLHIGLNPYEPYSMPKEVWPKGVLLIMPIHGGSVQKGYLLRPQIYKRVGISPVEAYNWVGKSVILVCKKAQKGS